VKLAASDDCWQHRAGVEALLPVQRQSRPVFGAVVAEGVSKSAKPSRLHRRQALHGRVTARAGQNHSVTVAVHRLDRPDRPQVPRVHGFERFHPRERDARRTVVLRLRIRPKTSSAATGRRIGAAVFGRSPSRVSIETSRNCPGGRAARTAVTAETCSPSSLSTIKGYVLVCMVVGSAP
jgi:hypothetical protein